MNRLRVLVVDDSASGRAELKNMLECEGDIRVVAEADNDDAALTALKARAPDLMIIGLGAPSADCLVAIERVMSEQPLPILVVVDHSRERAMFECLQRGALDLSARPSPADPRGQQQLRRMVHELARVPVTRHAAPRPRRAKTQPEQVYPGKLRVVGVGAADGGPNALVSLLSELPSDFPLCVAVVQHAPPGGVSAFAEFLSGRVRLPVRVAGIDAAVLPGVVYLAQEHRHLVALDSERLGSHSSVPTEAQRPALDALLTSLASTFGPAAIGVVLSGAGRDGTAGLLALKAAGSVTLAQDRASSAVFDMPRAAFEAGAARYCLEPRAIGRFLVQSAKTSEQRARSDARS
ncbi:MAG TPA: chemotaxis protein CheB [Polyangiaceae bacterium]|nr:chemotaxis protein CheB [Polyangiaceae bacterium]